MEESYIKALFLGPKAENQEVYETLIVETIKDACFLRKNFHPEDSTIISETDKLTNGFQNTSANLKQHLQTVLAELKKGVPLYHPRYIGHMHGDLLLSGIAAYFGSMLYNPNNVVGESSPATTKMEFDYIKALCEMVGYNEYENLNNKNNSWGHLTSGGTSANIEALWVARNIKYYPLSIKLLSVEKEDVNSELKYPFIKDIRINFLSEDIETAKCNDLFNLPTNEILELKDEIYLKAEINGIKADEIKKEIEKYSVVQQGVHGIHQLISETFKTSEEKLPLPKLYIAKSKHYSWDKAMDIIGIGQNNIVEIAIDNGYRMDIESLKSKFDKQSPALAVIGILGSSKQGSIDPIDKIIDFRIELEENEKMSFYFHVDGAYGGYFPSIIRDKDQTSNDSFQKVKSYLCETSLFTYDTYRKLVEVRKSDSITIDPHKMGYIPYPAGSILFANTRSKDFISYNPSYLNKPSDDNDIYSAFLGQWTLEGSRPGATAAACYLSNKLLPFHQKGHGILVKNTMIAANRFWNLIQETNNKWGEEKCGFKIIPTYIPETNIISYVLACPHIIKKTKYLNILTNKLYEKFSITGESIIPAQNFMVAKETFGYTDIPQGTLLEKCGIDEKDHDNIKTDDNKNIEITIISSVFMNPLSIYLDEMYYAKFFEEMKEYANNILSEIMLQIVTDKNRGERLDILWVENEEAVKIMKHLLEYKSNIGQFLNIEFVRTIQDAESRLKMKNYHVHIYDLNMKSLHHEAENLQNEIKPMIDFISTHDKQLKSKMVFYSQYFKNKDTNRIARITLRSAIPFIDENYQTIAKSNSEQDLRSLVFGIFSVIQNSIA